jgi:transcriptional regulator with XRE-family HTH domain
MSKPPQTLFGTRLREARLLAGLPQDKLGVAIGIDELSSSARISRYETGIHVPPYEIAERLAKVLHVPTIYFYCRDDRMAKLLLQIDQLDIHEVEQRIKPDADA